MNLGLHRDWKYILKHAWSVRLIALAAVLSGVQVTLPLIQPYVNVDPLWMAGGVGLATVGATAAALIARLMPQKQFGGRHGL